MARTVLALASTPRHTLAIVETASSGNFMNPPVRLSMVAVRNDELEELFARRVVGNPRVVVLDSCKVPAGGGVDSAFHRRLEAMRQDMNERIRLGPVATCDYPITDAAVLEDYRQFIRHCSQEQPPGALATIHLEDPETGIVDTLEGWEQARRGWPARDQRGRSPADRWNALREIVWVDEGDD